MKPNKFLAMTASLLLAAGGAQAASPYWMGVDLGNPNHKGSVTQNGATIEVNAGGSDYWGSSDSGYFYYTWATGQQWEAKVKVQDLVGPDAWTKCELMVRQSDPLVGPAADDAFIASMATQSGSAGNGVGGQYRQKRNTGAGNANSGSAATSYPDQWLRLTRTNAVFTVQCGSDGATWTTLMTLNTATDDWGGAWPDTLTVGIAVTAHNNDDATGATATISDLSVSFPGVTPPTVLNATVQPQSVTNYAGSPATFHFATTNNAVPNVVSWPTHVSYQWSRNGTAIPGATSTVYTFLTTEADNGAQFSCKATVLAPYNTTVSPVTSTAASLKVLPATVYNTGLKLEVFPGATRADVELGNVSAPSVNMVNSLDSEGGYGGNTSRRVSGYFIPPTTDTYTFFIAGDDDTDLFLSTDANPANKQLIAQEVGWSGTRSWLAAGGDNRNLDASKRSDQWTDTTTGNPAWTVNTSLTAGRSYYLEAVLRNGGGGDNLGVTYQTATMMAAANWAEVFTNGTPSLLQASNNNIAVLTTPPTYLTWKSQPANASVYEGGTAKFSAVVNTDSEMAPWYQWYRNGTAVAGATKADYSINNCTLAENNTQVYVVVRTPVESFSLTSSVVKVTVQQAVLEPGFAKVEHFWGATRATVLNGTAGEPAFSYAVPKFETMLDGDWANGFANRISGFFIPPATTAYTFFVCGDDDSDFYISTDATPTNKRLVAQETGWSGKWKWTSSGGGSDIAKKRSDQWSDASGATPYANGINLNGGTRYYVELVHYDGSGGENCEANYKKHTDPDPADDTDTLMAGSLIACYAPRCTYVTFTQSPVSLTVDPMSKAVFTVAGTTDSTLAVSSVEGAPQTNNFLVYQWQKNGTDIAGATTSSLTYGPVLPSDNGTVFACKIRALGLADNSLNRIWSNSAPATLTVTPSVYEPGFAKVEYWQGGTRLPVENETAGTPNWTTYIAQWDMGTGIGDNYARRYSGFFQPPVTDDYVFYFNADDDADLFLSTNESPATKRLIAQETQWGSASLRWMETSSRAEQRVTTTFSPDGVNTPFANGIRLQANAKYYMEAVQHEGGGGDYMQVLWTTLTEYGNVTNYQPVNMKGSVIGAYVPRCTYVAFLQQPVSQSTINLGTAMFSVVGTSDTKVSLSPNAGPTLDNKPLLYQWFKNGSPIPGATAARLVLSDVPATDNGAQIVCQMRTLGYGDAAGTPIWSNSAPAVLTVVPTAPTAYASIFTDVNVDPQVQYINIAFSKRMDLSTISSLANYQVTGGLTLTDLAVDPDGKGVKLIVTGTATSAVTVTIKSGKDADGIALAANTTVPATPSQLTFKDIGAAGDPAYPTIVWVDGPGAYTISAQGSDIWGQADGFNYAYEQKTGDFDVVVRQKSISHTSQWAKSGLMARESLEPGSRNWNIVNTPLLADGIIAPDYSGYGVNQIECNRRVATSGDSSGWDFNRGKVPNYPTAWVRLKRSGQLLSAFYSDDGNSWTLTATNTVTDLPASLYIGLCTTAHNNDVLDPVPAAFQYYNTAEYADYNSSYVAQSTPARLSATLSGGNVVIQWTPTGGHLESCTALGGTWASEGTANPATLPASSAAKFFRVVNP